MNAVVEVRKRRGGLPLMFYDYEEKTNFFGDYLNTKELSQVSHLKTGDSWPTPESAPSERALLRDPLAFGSVLSGKNWWAS